MEIVSFRLEACLKQLMRSLAVPEAVVVAVPVQRALQAKMAAAVAVAKEAMAVLAHQVPMEAAFPSVLLYFPELEAY